MSPRIDISVTSSSVSGVARSIHVRKSSRMVMIMLLLLVSTFPLASSVRVSLPVGLLDADFSSPSILSTAAPVSSTSSSLFSLSSDTDSQTTAPSPSPVSAPAVYRLSSGKTPLEIEENMVRLGWVSLGGVTLMALVLLTAYILRKRKARWLPDSSVAMLFGMIFGLFVAISKTPVQGAQIDEPGSLYTFDPKLFFFIFLPPIILDAGYSLKKRHFFSNIGVVSLYAGPGIIISTLVIGLGSYVASGFGVFGGSQFGLIESLMFGAMLSVTDSVATISILGSPDLEIDNALYSIIFGESVLNDAVGILLFDLLAKLSVAPEAASLPSFLLAFVTVSVGSVVLGIATGLLCSLMFKKLDLEDYPHFEFIFVLLFAYSSYVLALVMQLSGVMSLFACGAILGHYNWYNISLPSRTSTKFGFKAFSVACEMIVFVYLGLTFSLSLLSSLQYRWSVAGCVLTFFLVWIARAAYVFPLSWLANLRRTNKLTFNMQLIILAGGLRGAVSFALALNLHGPHYDVMVTTCLGIVIFTTLICGSVTDKVVRAVSDWIREEKLRSGTELTDTPYAPALPRTIKKAASSQASFSSAAAAASSSSSSSSSVSSSSASSSSSSSSSSVTSSSSNRKPRDDMSTAAANGTTSSSSSSPPVPSLSTPSTLSLQKAAMLFASPQALDREDDDDDDMAAAEGDDEAGLAFVDVDLDAIDRGEPPVLASRTAPGAAVDDDVTTAGGTGSDFDIEKGRVAHLDHKLGSKGHGSTCAIGGGGAGGQSKTQQGQTSQAGKIDLASPQPRFVGLSPHGYTSAYLLDSSGNSSSSVPSEEDEYTYYDRHVSPALLTTSSSSSSSSSSSPSFVDGDTRNHIVVGYGGSGDVDAADVDGNGDGYSGSGSGSSGGVRSQGRSDILALAREGLWTGQGGALNRFENDVMQRVFGGPKRRT